MTKDANKCVNEFMSGLDIPQTWNIFFLEKGLMYPDLRPL